MAHACSRMTRKPGVCMGASGPGATNLVDRRGQRVRRRRAADRDRRLEPARLSRDGGVPGDRPARGVQADHEVGDADLRRQAHPRASSRRRFARRRPGEPGRCTSTCPATSSARWSTSRTIAYADAVEAPRRVRTAIRARSREAIALLSKAERPLILGGSGVWWSDARARRSRRSSTRRASRSTRRRSRAGPCRRIISSRSSTPRATAFREADVAPGRRHPLQLS